MRFFIDCNYLTFKSIIFKFKGKNTKIYSLNSENRKIKILLIPLIKYEKIIIVDNSITFSSISNAINTILNDFLQ